MYPTVTVQCTLHQNKMATTAEPTGTTTTATYVMAGNDMMGVKPPSFDWDTPDLSKRFKTFKRYCEIILSTPTYATKTPKERVNYILLWMGPNAVDIFDNTKFEPEEDKENPEKVWAAFLTYFEPKSNYRLARFQLRDMHQGPSDSIDTYVTKLKMQAQKCNFSDNARLEDELIDQIIKGTANEHIRRKMLNQEPKKLTLDSVIDFARTFEATRSQMQAFTGASSERHVAEVRRHRSKSRNRDRNSSYQHHDNCMFCGGQSHPRNKCPARNEECNKCHKTGHWGKVCLSAKRERSSSSFRQRGHSSSNRGRGRARARGRGRGAMSRTQDRVHAVEEIDTDFEALTFDIIDVIDMKSKQANAQFSKSRSEAYATVSIKPGRNQKQAKLRGKADTGAQGNVMPLRTFRNIYPNRVDQNGKPTDTTASNVKLTAYNGTTIPQHGTITIPCKYNGEWKEATFYIADTAGPVIFGLKTCVALGLVTMNCVVNADDQSINQPICSAEKLREIYPDRFTGLGKFPGKYKLTLKEDANPVIHAPRRAPIQLRDKIQEELTRMTTLGVIRPVKKPTDWVSSITYVHKPDGSLRICLDPKDLNNNLKRAQQHIPTMEELTHRFANAKVFSKLDAKSGYWSIELDEDSQLLTTFNSPFGRFCFRRLPFGINVSGDIFNAAMQKILVGLRGVISIHDDITVYGEGDTIDDATTDHDKNLRQLMERARENNLVFNYAKTNILQPEIVFFGNIYGVKPDPAKIQAIQDIKPPSNVKELQSFLGMCTYLAQYVPNLSEKTTHLRTLLKQQNEFQWNCEQDKAFREIKDNICKANTLAYFNPNEPAVLKVDASLYALGAALTQNGKPVAYASKSLTETESRYANIERELLACVFGAERFNTYLYGKHFTIESDHKPLEMIYKKNLTAAPARLQRMLLRLQRYDYDIRNVPGREMTLPDSLSRLPKSSVDPELELNLKVCYVQFSTPKLAQLRNETDKDQELIILKRFISRGFPDSRREIPPEIRHYWSYRDQLSIDNGLIVKGPQIVIPHILRNEYLQRIHSAHQGITRCQQRARNSVYWPGINDEIEAIVQGCGRCQTYRKSLPKETLIPIVPEIPNVPWHTIGTDMFEVDGKDYLVIADYHSKFPIVEQIKSKGSPATAKFTRKMFGLFGNPNTIISDNGGAFIGPEYKEMVEELGIVHTTSSPKHSKSHGFIEAMVAVTKSLIRKSPSDTDQAILAYRTTPLGPGIPSPAELFFNRKIGSNLPIRCKGFASDIVRDKISAENRKSEEHYNQHAHELPELKLGQQIFYQDAAKRSWCPGVIVGIGPEPRSYTVECSITGRTLRRNRQLTRPRSVTFKEPPRMNTFNEDITFTAEPKSSDTPPPIDTQNQNKDIPKTPVLRRSQRISKPPVRYSENY